MNRLSAPWILNPNVNRFPVYPVHDTNSIAARESVECRGRNQFAFAPTKEVSKDPVDHQNHSLRKPATGEIPENELAAGMNSQIDSEIKQSCSMRDTLKISVHRRSIVAVVLGYGI